jgi:hypothetical protein
MNKRLTRRVIAAVGIAAALSAGALTACGDGGDSEGPASTTPTTTTAPPPPVSPTEKKINPTGGNLFTPPVTATPAPTAPPGDN